MTIRPRTFAPSLIAVLAVLCTAFGVSMSAHAAAIRQVQTGEVAFTTITQNVTLPVPLVSTSNAILFFSERTSNHASDSFLVRGNILNTTTLQFVRNVAGQSLTVRWYVAEFDSGVTVQRGDTTQTTTTTNKSITSVSLAESFVLASRERSGPTFSSDDFLRARLTTATNLEMALNAGTGGTNSWQVVTFAGASVQRGLVTMTSGTATLNQAITAVDTTRSFVLFSYSSPSGTAANIGQKMVRGWLSASNQIRFERSNTGIALSIAWEVVQLPVGNLVQEGLRNIAAGVAIGDVTIAAIDTNRTVAFSGSQSLGGQSWGRSTYSADDNPGVASFTHRLVNSTTLRLERAFLPAGIAADAAHFVVRFSAAATSGVARVGNWTTGLTHAPGIGDNRLLVFAVGYENAADVGVSAVTFGGQSLTRIGGAVAGPTTFARTELWYLRESNLLAATNNTFIVTWGGAAPTEPKYGAATYRNVDQTTPIGNSSGNFTNAATPNPLTTSVNVIAGGYAVSNAFCGNAGSYAWNNSYLEGFDQGAGSSTMSSADRLEAAPGASVASATHSGPNRLAIFAAALLPVGGAPNQAPILTPIGPRNVNEGQNLNFTVSASDPDLTTPVLSALNVPINATFTPGTGAFSFSPNFTQSGVHNVTFIASDGALADTEIVAITVTDVNQAPVLAAIGPRVVNENATLNFTVTASDPDLTTPVLSAVGVPTNATFTPGTGAFSFSPDFTQSGVYNVTFIASDGALADTEIVAITVNDVNRAPILATIGAQSVNENATLNFTVSASDPDLTTPTLSALNVPTNATFTPGTGAFTFSPDFTQSGVYNVTFIASDGALADTEIVAITVNDVNRAPVLAAIGSQNVNEGATLNFTVSASDPDLTTPVLSALNVPTNATFIPGTGAFTFSPDFTQSGVHNVTFIASDGALADTEIVAITVTDVNQAPVLAAIGPRVVNENATLNFTVTASDPDLTTPVLSAVGVPTNATFTPGTGAFSFSPNFTQSGVYNVTFIASDGALADTEIVAITVNDVNQPPVLATIGPRSVTEGQNLNFGVSSSDPDGTTPTVTAETVPPNATFTPGAGGTGSFDFNPSFTQASVYNVRFIASDGTLADTEIVAVTVNEAGNQRPVLAAIGAQSVNENATLNFTATATDPDLTTPVLSAENIPTNATFTPGTGAFTFSPDFTQSGVHNVTFIASDGGLADTEIVAITVNNVNQAPVLASIGAQSVNENATLNVTVTASDPDLTTPVLSALNVPANATFTPGTGAFSFSPNFTQSGVYNVTFIASDGALADTEIVAITVNDVNRAPVLSSIGAQSVNENATLNFTVTASDPDLTTPTLSALNLPANANFTSGTGAFTFSPNFTQSGVHNVTFIASDGALADTEIVAITINNVDRAPILDPIGAQSVNENATLNFTVTASDPDLTTPVLSALNVPTNATFTPGTGAFSFSPDFTQSGLYNVTFIATDGSLADTEIVEITVNNVNRAPVLVTIGAQSVDENSTLNFTVTASDPDLTTPVLSALNVPTNATFTPGTGAFSFAPDFTQSGVHNVTFIASDGALADTEIVAITVNNVNRAPVLAAIGSQSVNENATLNFTVTASDPDLTTPVLSALNVPTNATFTPGTGAFTFSPDFTQSGVYNVTFIASDGALADTEFVAITVNNVNQAPVLAPIGAQSVNENAALNFAVSSSDGDGTTPTASAENVPTNALFTPNGSGGGAFGFSPDFTQSGVYNVRFISSDGSLADTEIVMITVVNVNRAPILAAIGAQNVNEGATLNFTVTASDPDLTTLVLSALSVPTNATFTPGTGAFSFSPDFTQSGVFNVTFIASDGELADTEVVAITVNNVNQAPTLVAIGAQSVNENAVLNFTVTASDPDLTTPILSALNVPANATFTPGTGAFTFSPDFTQSGVYNVTFIASDGALADTEVVAITVNNVNRVPNLATIGAQSVNENATLNFTVTASDPDLTTPVLSALNVPANATFTPGTGAFTFSPDFTQSGVHNVTFIASDGALADTEIVAITVNNVNRAPVLAAIGAQSVNEGAALNFTVTASDPDLTTPVLSALNLPTNATFTPGTGAFSFSPDFTQSGVYNVTFIASDGALADTEIVAITVNNVNQTPVLAAIGAQSVSENATLNFTVTASDPDLTTPVLSALNVPTNATFTPGTGAFSFSPDFTQSGVYNVTFIASDGSLADTEVVAVTVNNVNRAPVLAAIGAQSVDENASLNFTVTASDPDLTTPVLSALNVPANATFTPGTGAFTFSPDFTQSGIHNVTFIASDGALADTEIVAITVNNVNRAPSLATIGAQSVNENATLNFTVTASDPDLTTPVLSALNLPTNATFTPGTGAFSFSPDFTQSGVYNVTFIASDGALADTEIVAITVNNTNRAPVLASIGAQSVNENATLNFTVTASDPDLTTPVLSALNVPTNATFTPGTGAFSFSPDFTQSGVYNVTFVASDGGLADTEIVAITVNNVNRAPVLATIGAQSVNENATLNFTVTASDPDLTTPVLSALNVPTNATFTPGTGAFSFSPNFTQSGVYNVTFIASDGALADTEIVAITVNNVNRAPVLAAIGAQSVNESATLNFTVTASDPDLTTPTLSALNVPTNATFTPGTGAFTFSPDFTQSGVYNVTFIATDGSLADSEIVAITVSNTNRVPVLASIGAQSVNENATLNFTVTASDPDLTTPVLSALNVPTNATFTPGTGAFTFSPSFTQSGVYNVTFIASDGSLADTEIVVITVNNVNRAPVLAAIGAKTVNENATLNFTVTASDPDLTTPVLSALNVPTNATFTPGTGAFTFSPSFTQSGVYNVTFIATDGSLADSEIVVITVNDVNRAPVLATIGPRIINEGQNLNFGTSATDPDGSASVMTALSVPLNATYTDHGNGTATFDFNPSFTQSGVYNVAFIASDGALADTEIVVITVNNTNRAPVLATIGPRSVTEGQALNFGVSASDPDLTTPTLAAENVPANASFIDNLNGTGTFTFNPNFIQAGVYNVRFIASDGSLTDTELVVVTVNEAGNQSPILAPIGTKSVTEGLTLVFRVSATDPEFAQLTLFTSILPTGAVFVDSLNGAGSLTWTPTFAQAGTYFITFAAQDPPGAIDNELVRIDVLEAGNQGPVLAAIGPRSVAEGANLNFNASATDPDATTPTLSAVNLPANATFNNNGNGTGTFNFNAAFGQAGVYNVTFIATDGTLADSEIVAITVGNVNEAPILAPIGAQSVNENATLNFAVSSTDPDGTTPTASAENVPANASFTPNGSGGGAFAFSPNFTQSGIYNVRFISSDGVLADTEIVAITVNNVNRAPVLASIGAQSVNENATLNFTVTASDPDLTTPVLSALNVPTNATFTPGTGAFTFSPNFTQSGVYNVTFIATDGSLADTEIVAITVNNVNRAPILAAIGAQSVNENATLNFTVTASDPDLTTPVLSALNVPTNATFTPGTGAFTFSPNFTQSGVYNVTFIATDGLLADSEIVAITVNNVNRAPVLAAIGAQSVNENATLNFTVTASDPDLTTPVLSALNVPTNATFTPGTGAFTFSPNFTQSGVYNVTFIASDGGLADTEIVAITVNNVNRAPVLAAIGAQSVNENATLNFTVTASDPDLTTPVLSALNVPVNATFTPGTGAFTFSPNFTQSGVYNVTFIATDGTLADSEIVAITVNNTNRAPILAAIGAQTVAEGANLNFGVSASDADGAIPVLSAVNAPVNATFINNGNGTGTFDFNPNFSQAGVYNVTFIASDGSLADSEVVAITVTGTNLAPVLNTIGARSVDEGQNLNFGVSSSDPDGTTPTVSAENVPANGTFTPGAGGTGTFNFNPNFTQSGVFNVRFIATDGLLSDTEMVAITVNNVNLAPVLAPIGARSVSENATLNFTVTASDPDLTTPVLSALNVPTNATFTPGTGAFTFSPNFTQSGVYNVTFIASDGALADTEIVPITVNNTNRAPVLASIGAQSVNENATLNFTVTASDPDLSTPVLSALNVPTNATFTPGTGAFTFSPNFTQSGVYNVTFIASDGALADTEIVAITVNNVNRAPVLASIGSQSVNENAVLNFTVTASDPDLTTPVLSALNVPANATFTPATGAFSFSPNFTQSGVFNVTFIASDGALADSEVVVITVNNVNRAPVLAAIGAQSVNENATLNFTVTASDPDLTTPVLSALNVPTNATFTPGTGAFTFSPNVTQSGVYNVTFIASDGSLADTEIVAITVNQVNQSPVLAAIGSRNVTEGANLNFGVSASDVDATPLSLVAQTAPLGSTFIDNGNGTGTFNFTPNFTQAAVYNVRFIVSDGALADTEIVAITVNEAGNQRPVLAAIGARSVTEGQTLNFGISANDADATTPILTAVNAPPNANLTDNGNGTATFVFNPSFTQAAVYNVTFIAFDGSLADSEVVTITVNEAGNQRPVLATIGPRSVSEGLNLNFNATATDPDATTPALFAEAVPLNATFIDNGNGSGTFNFNPDFTQSGIYNVRFIASDGVLADTEMVAITVSSAGNQRPVLAAIGPRTVNEGANLNFIITGSDPDATIPLLIAQSIPLNATFNDNGDGTGEFDFSPSFTQAGVFNVRFIATDGSLADTELVAITVNNTNRAPILASIGAQSVNENATLNFTVTASDPDLTTPVLSALNVPTNATFTPGTGAFSFSPNFTQSGVFNVTFIATDGSLADTEIVVITVNNANRAPILASIGAQSVNENATLNFTVTASDPDLTTPVLSALNIPTNATFAPGTGAFTFSPNFTQSGVYNVTFIASDGSLADTEIVAITVNNVNRAPVLAAIGAQSVNENATLNFTVSATDPDLTTPVLSALNVPTNATFTPGTGAFTFSPSFTQSGVYNVTFIATDGALADSELVVITVNNVNRAPVLASIGAQSVNENATLNFTVTASDPDLTTPVLSALNVPTNATFTPGTGAFTFSPSFTQSGVYNVTFIATDGALADSEIVAITVNNSNRAPILTSIGAQSVNENATLNFTVTASDPDLTTPVLSAMNVPTNASFTPGTGAFTFSPSFTQSGVYNVTFIASDGSLADTEIVAITVNNTNRAPALASIGAQSVNENATLNFTVTASDPDLTTPVLSALNVPTNATFTPGTGAFTFSPSFTQSGVYNVTFIATDGALADTEIVAITVNNVNAPPVLATIGARNVSEGQNLNFNISATDIDATTPSLSAENVPTNATFVNNGNGSGTFNFNPDFTQAGVYNVRFIATDGLLADTELVLITVTSAGNQRPVLALIGPRSVNEGATLNFIISATDADATTPILIAQSVPANASFNDDGNGTGTFNFSPSFTQAGVFNVRFIATDGSLADTELVAITVNNVNRAPVLATIGAQSVNENATLNFTVAASDPDLTTPILSALNVPTNATFTPGTGAFTFSPNFTQSGVYNVTFIATDGVLADTEIVAITVNNTNRAPVLASIGAQSVNENATLNFTVTASDPDLTTPVLSALNVPTNATFTPGTGAFTFSPNFTQSGVHNVTFIASDGVLADTEVVAITVNNVNRAPVLASIGSQSVNENAVLNFTVTASDPDLTTPVLSALNIPTNATFTPGTGAFSFSPSFTQSGVHNVTFIASDGALADTEIVAITVNNVNRAPILAAIGAQSVNENATLNFTVTASDPDLTTPTLSALNVPTNATFTPVTGAFTFSPDFTQSGVYNLTFIATDGALADSEIVAITVSNSNRAPILASIGAQSVNENATLNFTVTASDPDLTIPVLSALNVPTNATFTPGTGAFTFSPNFTQSGVYNVTFIASDGSLADTEIVAITVNNTNRAPVLATIGAQSVNENATLNFTVTASDPDLTTPVLSALNVPSNATFTPGTGAFTFSPSFTQSGVYNVTFIASDGALADTEIVGITVNDINARPVLATIGPRIVNEGQNLNFNISATDIDATIPVLTAVGVPINATFNDNLNGSGTFDFNPSFAQSGVYNVTFIASDGALADSEVVIITVTEQNRAPVANAGPNQGPVAIGSLVTLDGSASSDIDGDSLTYAWLQILGPAVTLSPNGPLATFTPAIASTYRFRLIVNDGQLPSPPDTTEVTAISQPDRVTDLLASVSGNTIQLTWGPITTDTSGATTSLSRYVIYRGTRAYYTPTPAESIGVATAVAVSFTDNNIGGADVVGDTGTNYFYCIQPVDVGGGRAGLSNRVGEYDYRIITTSTTDFTFIMMPFAGTGIATASDMIQSIGVSNVNTLNRFNATSQSYESRFAAGFGPNFPIVPGGIYQVNASTPTIWSIAGRVPDSGTISYSIITTSTTDFSFIGVPFERELDFTNASGVISSLPGVFNTLNRFIPTSQSYESRFAAGFGPNFQVKAGRVYQANAASNGVFPAP